MVVHDVLGSGVVVQRVDRQAASVTGAFEAAPRGLGSQHQVGIDPDSPGVQLTGDVVAATVRATTMASGGPMGTMAVAKQAKSRAV